MTQVPPREGMMAVVRNRHAMITGVQPFDAGEAGRLHLVEVEYTESLGHESEQVLWEVEPGTSVLEPAALPQIPGAGPMDPREFDAMVRAARWSALTPSLPFSGLSEDSPPLASPLFGAIYPESWQLVPVLRALQMPRVALMLADAVGLGKTIQAGMVIRELMLRRRIRRILVICPAALRTQWRDEMNEKFSLPFEVVDRPETLRLQRELGVDANPWRTHERIIASYHYLKQADVLEQFRSAAEPGEDARLKWDLLVVDEAHNLAPSSFGADSDLAEMLQSISPWFEHRIFLTATPHNGHTRSFSGLLEALDPVRFTRKSELDEEDRRRVGETVIRRLKREINQHFVQNGQAPRFSDREVKALPQLHFGRHERQLLATLRDFRRALRSAVASADHTHRIAAYFASEVLQKRLLSGPWAFGQSWLALMDGLNGTPAETQAKAVNTAAEITREDTDDDNERESRQRHAENTVGTWLQKWAPKLVSEIQAVSEEVRALGVTRVEPGLTPDERRVEVKERSVRVAADARMKALETLVEDHLRHKKNWRSDERLVIFTEYLASLEYIAARLQARFGSGDWLLFLYGGMNDAERDGVKRAFNDPDGTARILIATDAAGEGLNLQRVARYMLHWDIPWNPSRMEQRNGRLDRHGQKRDVTIWHFDSADDASMSFLARLLRKRSTTREDRVVTDEIFAEAIVAHFENDEDAEAVDERLDRVIENAKSVAQSIDEDLPSAEAIPGEADAARLERLRAEVDVSPQSLRETLETALAIQSSRPRLERDARNRDRLLHPVPGAWRDIVDHTLRQDGPSGGLRYLVFDPAHYVHTHDGTPQGRPVYTPEPDSSLLHLGHAIYQRVMSSFARYRFPGGPSRATRWTVRHGEVPVGASALILVTVEELAVNNLREACHHWVRTIALPVMDGELADPLPERPASDWSTPEKVQHSAEAVAIWDDIGPDVRKRIQNMQKDLTRQITSRLQVAGKAVTEIERKRFDKRKRELEKALTENQIAKLGRELEQARMKAKQQVLLVEINQELLKKISDIEMEIQIRKSHYEEVMAVLESEKDRTLRRILPQRYTLRGDARVYPIAIDIRLPGEGV